MNRDMKNTIEHVNLHRSRADAIAFMLRCGECGIECGTPSAERNAEGFYETRWVPQVAL